MQRSTLPCVTRSSASSTTRTCARTLLLAMVGIALPAMAAATGAAPSIPIFSSAAQLSAQCEQAIGDARAALADLAAMPLDSARGAGLLRVWDAVMADLEDVINPAYLQAYTHHDAAIRGAGEGCILAITRFSSEIYQDENLYQRVRAATPDDAIDTRFRQDLLHNFEDAGVSLPAAERRKARELVQNIQKLGQEFQRNIRENNQTLSFSPAEQKGLPDSYLKRVKHDEAGNIVVGFDYPEVIPFLDNAENGAARERYYRAFSNRGTPRNLELLSEIVELRRELAGLYGLPSYAAFVTRRRMVGNPQTVHRFLEDVTEVVREVESKDLQALRELKSIHEGTPIADTRIHQWDKSFYTERLRRARFSIDQEALRRFFPMPQTTAWVIDVTEELYGLTFRRRDAETWAPGVETWDIYDRSSDQYIGSIYLDLHPRDGKYKHAAAFGLRGSSTQQGRTPITALVTNFDRNGLTHRELETYLHEFGHALHGVLSATRYSEQAGTSVERDFVEAPSQMYEEWARDAATLKRMQSVCGECPVMDDDLIERLNAARRMARGIHYGRQHLYASYDMALYDTRPRDVMNTWRSMEGNTPIGHAEGTQFPATFGHIAGGYAAGYYGYMWSEALALDMLSQFKGKLMNPKVGRRFRETILARGSEVPADAMVRQFLGRETRPDAFFRELRGQRVR